MISDNDLDLVVILPNTSITIRDALDRGLLEPPHNRDYGEIHQEIFSCPVCGESFTAYPSEKRIYCSQECSNSFRRGKTFEERFGIERAREIGEKISKANKGMVFSLEHREKLTKVKKELWKDPEYVKMIVEAWNKKPNKLEKVFNRLLQLICPGEFKYVGNKKFVLGRKHPDFLNVNKKKLIEIYGEYWHKESDAQERIDHFKKFGYDTLVVWEHEILDEPLKVAKRVLLFIGRNERGGSDG